jgi:hypothetical protein
MDQIGWSHEFGDLEEGSFEGRIVLRAYSQCLRQLLRSCHWNMARKEVPMVLQADATGSTPGVGNLVPGGFIYSYQYPIDCMKVRYVPWRDTGNTSGVPQGNIQPVNPGAPIVGGLGSPIVGHRPRPARFLEAMDVNYPPPGGAQTWDVQGVSPQGRTVICTNVQNASLVYTALMNYPSNWDAQFRAAFVAYLAAEVALPLWAKKNPKFGMAMRTQQLAVAKEKIMQARVTDGNEGFSNSDFSTDWIRTRRTGGSGYGNGWGGEMVGGGTGGMFFGGCDDCCGAGNTGAY